jgi:hypothetical protein
MAALIFPPTPALGQKFPANPGTSGVTQWQYDGTKWVVVPTTISLGSPNQGAFNDYQWPAADGLAGRQLTTDGAGNLTWSGEADINIQALGITPLCDGVSSTFTLVLYGTGTFFTPVPSTNIVVFLGGVPQVPTVNYNVVGNQITFTDIPPNGTTFYAISTVTY